MFIITQSRIANDQKLFSLGKVHNLLLIRMTKYKVIYAMKVVFYMRSKFYGDTLNFTLPKFMRHSWDGKMLQKILQFKHFCEIFVGIYKNSIWQIREKLYSADKKDLE